jgi:hypothetical protein
MKVRIHGADAGLEYLKKRNPGSSVSPWYVDKVGEVVNNVKERGRFYLTEKYWFIVKEDAKVVEE